MKKKLLALSALAALCLPSVASCGGSKPTGSDSGSMDTSCKSAPKGTIVVTFWHAFKNVNQKTIMELTQRFNEEHKGKVCVEMSAQNDYDTIYNQMIAVIQAGSSVPLPDIATTYPDHVASYANSNIVIDMDQYINSSDASIAMPKTGSESWEDILPSYREESTSYRFNADDMKAEKGKTYSLPLNKSTEVMYYNKTFFDYWTGKEAVTKNGEHITDIYPSLGLGNKLEDQIHKPSGSVTQEQCDKFNQGAAGGLVKMIDKTDGKNGKEKYKTPVEWGLKNPADIDPSDISTWWTWDDVKTQGEIVQAITKSKYNFFKGGTVPSLYTEVQLSNPSSSDKIYSNRAKNGNVLLSYDSSSNLFVTLANQVNSYVSLDQNAKPQLKFTSKEALDQYEMYEKLYDAGIATIPGLIGDGSLKYATTPFTNEYLFLSVGSIAGANLNFGGLFETGVAPIPQASLSNAKVIQQGTNITMLNRKGSTIDITSKDPKDQAVIKKTLATWEYVKFITGHDANLEFATKTTYLPTRTSVINSKEYQAFLNSNVGERKALKVANTIAQTGATFTDPPFVNSGNIRSGSENQFIDGLSASASDMRSTITAYYEECKKTLGIS